MSPLSFMMRVVNKLVRGGQPPQPKTCKGCKHLLYDKNGGHWCTRFAENCSTEHQPLNNGKCYEGGGKCV